jgi:hypothetical protein
LLKNILSFLSPVAISINKVASMELLFLKHRSLIKTRIVISRYDLQHRIKSKVLALSYVPIFC